MLRVSWLVVWKTAAGEHSAVFLEEERATLYATKMHGYKLKSIARDPSVPTLTDEYVIDLDDTLQGRC
jgi:hypothetical protein